MDTVHSKIRLRTPTHSPGTKTVSQDLLKRRGEEKIGKHGDQNVLTVLESVRRLGKRRWIGPSPFTKSYLPPLFILHLNHRLFDIVNKTMIFASDLRKLTRPGLVLFRCSRSRRKPYFKSTI